MAESLLGRARVAMSAGRLDAAEEDIERAAGLAGDLVWLHGWAVRVRASMLLERGDQSRAQSEFAIAFEVLRGHGFQENLLLARLAALPAGTFAPERFPVETLRHVGRLVADRHQNHGVRPSECPTCRSNGLPGRAAHALGIVPGVRVPAFWST